ncbi:hypothetical protein [Orbus mooreae]|uniref:hypothetical protein n=1 Tax=Orbus mooreae TaxID=3074107 RepID=UPI00370D3B7C
MKDLANYITHEPNELIMQCIATTRSAIDTTDAGFRETLLYVLIDRQLQLALALGALDEHDLHLSEIDN